MDIKEVPLFVKKEIGEGKHRTEIFSTLEKEFGTVYTKSELARMVFQYPRDEEKKKYKIHFRTFITLFSIHTFLDAVFFGFFLIILWDLWQHDSFSDLERLTQFLYVKTLILHPLFLIGKIAGLKHLVSDQNRGWLQLVLGLLLLELAPLLLGEAFLSRTFFEKIYYLVTLATLTFGIYLYKKLWPMFTWKNQLQDEFEKDPFQVS